MAANHMVTTTATIEADFEIEMDNDSINEAEKALTASPFEPRANAGATVVFPNPAMLFERSPGRNAEAECMILEVPALAESRESGIFVAQAQDNGTGGIPTNDPNATLQRSNSNVTLEIDEEVAAPKGSNICWSDKYAHLCWYRIVSVVMAVVLVMLPLIYVLVLTGGQGSITDFNCPLNNVTVVVETTEDPLGPYYGTAFQVRPKTAEERLLELQIANSPGIPIEHLDHRQFGVEHTPYNSRYEEAH